MPDITVYANKISLNFPRPVLEPTTNQEPVDNEPAPAYNPEDFAPSDIDLLPSAFVYITAFTGPKASKIEIDHSKAPLFPTDEIDSNIIPEPQTNIESKPSKACQCRDYYTKTC